jgi:hypothetical protein
MNTDSLTFSTSPWKLGANEAREFPLFSSKLVFFPRRQWNKLRIDVKSFIYSFSLLRAQVNLSRHRATSYSGQPHPDAIKNRWTAEWTGIATARFLHYLSKLFQLKRSCNIEWDRKTMMNFDEVIILKKMFVVYLTKTPIKVCEINEEIHKIVSLFCTFWTRIRKE